MPDEFWFEIVWFKKKMRSWALLVNIGQVFLLLWSSSSESSPLPGNNKCNLIIEVDLPPSVQAMQWNKSSCNLDKTQNPNV